PLSASGRSRAHEPPPRRQAPAVRASGGAAADVAAAGAARRHPRLLRTGPVRDHLLPPVVPAGALGRPVPGPGLVEPGAPDRDPGTARADVRPERHPARRLNLGSGRARIAPGPA